MLDELEAHLGATIDPPPAPDEYEDFLLCQSLGCLPSDLEEMDDGTYWLYRRFLRVEREAARVRRLRDVFYGRG